MAGRKIPEALFEAGSRFLARATHAVMESPRGQEAVARAVGMAQRGRRRLEEAQERVLAAAGIPGRKDYEDLARQLARIKRKTRELSERLAGASPQDEAEDDRR